MADVRETSSLFFTPWQSVSQPVSQPASQPASTYRLRNPTLAAYTSTSSSSSSSISPPLWAAAFFLFTCRRAAHLGLCIGTSRRKPGTAWAEAEWEAGSGGTAVKVQGISVEVVEEEGLVLWTDEYPELGSLEKTRGSRGLLLALHGPSAAFCLPSWQELSSSLERARQRCSLSAASVSSRWRATAEAERGEGTDSSQLTKEFQPIKSCYFLSAVLSICTICMSLRIKTLLVLCIIAECIYMISI